MSPTGVLVVGSGKRVRDAALPAFASLPEDFEVRGVFARTPKRIEVRGRSYEVRALSDLVDEEAASAGLLYLAVGKNAVPQVLADLAKRPIGHLDLLIDTPVVRFKHFRHVDRIASFRNAWVSEDCATLPWMDALQGCLESGRLGALKSVRFERSAYAYHGVATAKTLLDCDRVTRARRRRTGGGSAERTLHFANGRTATVVEPRDYSLGRIVFRCERGTITDKPLEGESAFETIVPVVAGADCLGFRLGDLETRLTPAEVELARGDPPEATLTARMESMKRVGFARLLERIRDGRGAYPLAGAVDDMVVDYHLEKAGLWISNPLTDPRFGLGRMLLRTVSRLGG